MGGFNCTRLATIIINAVFRFLVSRVWAAEFVGHRIVKNILTHTLDSLFKFEIVGVNFVCYVSRDNGTSISRAEVGIPTSKACSFFLPR